MPDDICGVIIAAFTGKNCSQPVSRFSSPVAAQEACRRFAARWRKSYPTMVRQLQKDLPELLSFFYFPQHLWRELRNTNIIERAAWKSDAKPGPWSALDRISYSIFPAIQPRLEKSHPQAFYTSG
jgi:Transposase, Mutator family